MTGPNVAAIQSEIKRMLKRFPEAEDALFTLLGWTISEDDKEALPGCDTQTTK